jgi:dihydroorotase
VTLERSAKPLEVPGQVETGDGPVVVFDPGFPLHWRVVD